MTNLLKRAAVACAMALAFAGAVTQPAFAQSTIVFSNGNPAFVSGSLTSASGGGSLSAYVIPVKNVGFNVTLSGTASASVVLERSFDGGVTWVGLYAAGAKLYSWSYTGTALSEVAVEPEFNVLYRLRCTSYTSGTVSYRISQVLN